MNTQLNSAQFPQIFYKILLSMSRSSHCYPYFYNFGIASSVNLFGNLALITNYQI